MSHRDERPKTIVEELEDAGDELEELSKFYAKRKGREVYNLLPVKGVGNLMKPRTQYAMKRLQEIDSIPTRSGSNDDISEGVHTSFMDKDTYELVNMISMLNKEPDLLPSRSANIPQTQITEFTQTSDDYCCCGSSQAGDSTPNSPRVPCRFCKYIPDDEDSMGRLSTDYSVVLNHSNHEQYCRPTDFTRNTSIENENCENTEREEIASILRMPKMKSIPARVKTKKNFISEYQQAQQDEGYHGESSIGNGDSEIDSQYGQYRNVNMNSYSGRDRVLKSPSNLGLSSSSSLGRIQERRSYPSSNTNSLHLRPPKARTLSSYSPSPLTSILTGTDGKLMTGPNAVARLRDHQQTSSKLFQPQNETGHPRWPQRRTQLTVQNLKPSSNAAENSNVQLTSNDFDSLDSAPNLLRSPKQSSLRGQNLSSRSYQRQHSLVSPSYQQKPSSETFTVGVVKRLPPKQKPKITKPIASNTAVTKQTGYQAADTPPWMNRKSATESSGSGNFGKASSVSTIERRHSTEFYRTKSGSENKREGKKFRSPRVKKSNESTKTDPQTIDFFDNEKFNSLLMKMMAETDTPDDGTKKIMTKKLKMPNKSSTTNR